MARDAKFSSYSIQTFYFLLAFSFRGKKKEKRKKKCINRNKETQIAQKEGSESIRNPQHMMFYRPGGRYVVRPSPSSSSRAQPTRVLRARNHSCCKKKLEKSLLQPATKCNTLPILKNKIALKITSW